MMATTISDASGLQAKAGKYLSFALGSECYAVPVLKVREIIRLAEITPVPQLPPHVRGVINLRGKIVPVVDLRIKLALGPSATTPTACIVIVNLRVPSGGLVHMGLMVDGVDEVVNVGPGDIEETPDFGTALRLEHLLGMAKIKGKILALVDIDRLLVEATLEQGSVTAASV
jgi:purine-binding chemotaxis protein CheW